MLKEMLRGEALRRIIARLEDRMAIRYEASVRIGNSVEWHRCVKSIPE